MSTRGRTTARAGASASRSSASSSKSSTASGSKSSSSKSSTSTSSGSSSASTSSSGVSSSGAGAARSARSSSSVSVSSPSGSKSVTTTKTTTPTETTKETTAQPSTPISVSADLAKAISDSQQAYPDAWTEATGTSNIQQQFEQVTGTTIPQIIVEAPEPIIEEPIIAEPIIEIPEILPQVFAEQQPVLAEDIIQILNDIENGVILVPDWFRNNINWVKSGEITQQEFRSAYNYLLDQQIAHPPEENLTITDNMITQQVINFNIVNGRAVGSIKFEATNNFNPYYYNKNIVNIIQFKDPNGTNILTYVKENNLNFTVKEQDEVINYDEDIQGNTRATLESFVWLSTASPRPFSKQYTIDISETEPPKPTRTDGFMGAGVLGLIGILMLGGFIADHVRKRK